MLVVATPSCRVWKRERKKTFLLTSWRAIRTKLSSRKEEIHILFSLVRVTGEGEWLDVDLFLQLTLPRVDEKFLTSPSRCQGKTYSSATISKNVFFIILG